MSLFQFLKILENTGFQRGFQKGVSSLNCINMPCLTDLASTNGTELDGELLTPNIPYVIHEGAEVKLGKSLFRFEMV